MVHQINFFLLGEKLSAYNVFCGSSVQLRYFGWRGKDGRGELSNSDLLIK